MLSMSLYFLPVALQLLAGYGLYLGGPWVYIAIGSFPALMIIDASLPRDYSKRNIPNKFMANLPLYVASVCGLGLYFVFAWRIAQGMTTTETIGAIAGVAWLSVVPMVPVTHELYHQRGWFSRFLGLVGQIVYFDCTRSVAHVIGHHIDVATTVDSDTSLRGKDLYSFTVGALVESTHTSMRAECDALEKRGKGRWSLGHRLWKAIAMMIVMQTPIYFIGGWHAVALCMLAMFVARVWAESFNYFQHYGLVRAPGAPIAARHVWNHLHPLSRIFGWEIVNHADHHLDSFKPYHVLVPDASAVKMPSVFICFLTALIPPVWQNFVAKPALKEWDLTKATAEERRIARQQNLAAGWPDWFSEVDARPARAAA
jgi:alkane 1-monooxygenase/p-cymene monooxygenase